MKGQLKQASRIRPRYVALFTDEGYPAGPSDIVGRLERFGSAYSRVVVADLDGEMLGFVAYHALPRLRREYSTGMYQSDRSRTASRAAATRATAAPRRPTAPSSPVA